jgi:long-chain fatty acid transport protein
MKRLTLAATTLVAVAGTAQAGGIDRSGQSVQALFEKGNYVELSFGAVSP